MQEDFIQAIHDKHKVRLTFFSKEDNHNLTRLCAPMDYGPSWRATDKTPRYNLWDYESDKARHTLSLLPNQIVTMEITSETFDPSEFITWDVTQSPWFTPRDRNEWR